MNPLRAGLLVLASLGAALAQTGGAPAAAGKPERVVNCLEDRFADQVGPFNSVRFVTGKTPTLIDADDFCLTKGPETCTKRVPLAPTHAWLAGARTGGFVCVTDGKQYGWTPLGDIELGPAPKTAASEWLGTWINSYGEENNFKITTTKEGRLHVLGTAQWQAGPDATPHLGDLDADGVIVSNELRLGEVRCLDLDYQETHDECAQCVARLMFVNGRILVRDNRFCGGMNVNFDGIYDRRGKIAR